ncbi:IS30 family transposase [Streptomyces cinereoruber]|uniref:IS30 family transposase n=1 Tax=Streptomyces cinereoruber TaxID=67260 RepID=UPI003C2B2FFB
MRSHRSSGTRSSDTRTTLPSPDTTAKPSRQTHSETISKDRGREIAEHQAITAETRMSICLCKPRSPWQRGTNENTNRLLRQYLSEGADLRTFSQAGLDAIAHELNRRPRKSHGYRTPAEVYAGLLNSDDALTS